MNNKNIWSIVSVGLAVIVLLFGNNIYFQTTGKSFFSSTNLKYSSLGAVAIAVLVGLGIILYRRSNAFIIDNTKSFVSGAWSDDGTWHHINGFIFYAQNKSKKPITAVSGFLRSNITNEKYPIYLVDYHGNNIPPSETNGIPPRIKGMPIFNTIANYEVGIGSKTG